MLENQQIEEFIQLTKEAALGWLESPDEDGERFFPPRIGVVHNGQIHIWVFPRSEGGSRNVVDALRPIIQGMEADAVVIANDTMRVKEEVAVHRIKEIDGVKTPVKRDGTPWERGEMQKAMKNQTEDAPDLTEAILVQYFDRIGNSVFCNLGYEVDESGKVTWTDRMDMVHGVGGAEMRGWMPDTIREFFELPTLSTQMARMEELEKDLDDLSETARVVMPAPGQMTLSDAQAFRNEFPEQAFAHQACAVIKLALLAQGCALMIGSVSDEVAKIYRESLTEGKGTPMPEGIAVQMLHMSDHPLKDKLVRLRPFWPKGVLVEGAVFEIRNWVDMVDPNTRMSWQQQMDERPNWALRGYVERIGEYVGSYGETTPPPEVLEQMLRLMASNEVVYGHVVTKANRHGLGFLVHIDEIGEEVDDAALV